LPTTTAESSTRLSYRGTLKFKINYIYSNRKNKVSALN
jgi:hypothetical protein